ncbi:hypothetical protein [Arthrobacter sp. Soil762]|uniref:hypothetical protein n=1 Tax=Arthrobacter sp. Soil762 TaxID=1736401 RepID=UPI000B04EBD3
MSLLTGKPVDESVTDFPPVYSDFGKNFSLGDRIFINSGCKFQDHGGVAIGDDCLIGHNVVIATLNHDIMPSRRADMHPPLWSLAAMFGSGRTPQFCRA